MLRYYLLKRILPAVRKNIPFCNETFSDQINTEYHAHWQSKTYPFIDRLAMTITPGMLTLIPDTELAGLLSRKYRGNRKINYSLTRRASIKDIIESLHIPHTEVHSIKLNNREISFTHIPKDGETIFLHAFSAGTDVTCPTLLRPDALPTAAFIVDINVGKLARLLRMSGIDTVYNPHWQEEEVAELAAASRRILLSRNHDLLCRKCIAWGHLVRAEDPEKQLAEVLTLFGLHDAVKPFSRCLQCNTLLQPVEKSAILHRLEPLTRKYYHHFHTCPDCERIYWRGSHHKRMEELINRVCCASPTTRNTSVKPPD